MELNQLRYFLEVAQSQHMTRSAEQLHIAQSALSRAIHNLETELGVPLFSQRGRNIVLTECGRFFREKLTPILDQLDALPEQLQTMACLENDTIHLNVLAASVLLTEAVIEYEKEHPPLNFQLMQNPESELYDICVTTRLLYRVPEGGSAEQFMYPEQIYLAVPAGHPLARRGQIDLAEAASEGFIVLTGAHHMRWICDQFCRHAGFTPRIIFESDNSAAVRNAIAANLGVGFWPQFSWGRLESARVKLLEIREPVCQREIIFDMKRNKADCTAVQRFFDFLRRYCGEAQAHGMHL